MVLVLYGAIAMACCVAALFFFRFWHTTRDRLLLFFALAFAVLGAHWAALGALDLRAEERYFLYVPRLLAFLLIIVGIVDKNWRHR